MMLKLTRVSVLAAAAMVAAAAVAHTQSDPFVGTWRMNPAKSKYDPGPMPKSITSVWEAAGKGYKIMVTNESATGKSQYSYSTNLDGQDSKVTGTNPNADALTVTRIDARTIQSVSKLGGKVTVTQRNVIAADGKSRTVTTTGTDPKGQKVHNVAVFEKQ